MKPRIGGPLRVLWWRLRGSLWFVPAILVTLATAAALGFVMLDEQVGPALQERWPAVFGVGAEGARSLLSAIATASLTVAGTMFAVTLAVLSLAASQYSPRVLRTFISDRPTQVVLGFFVALFAYCLVVLRTIRGGETSFVPSLAVLGGIVAAFTAIALLVYFIHHLAESIEAASILGRLVRGTARTIETLFPDELGEGVDEPADGADAQGPWTPAPARASGYVVSLDSDRLLGEARRLGRVVRVERAIGEFAMPGEPLVSLAGGAAIDEADARALLACFSIDRQRTVEQDAEFGLQQISDIALKALSAGINDQSTAVMCVDRLSELVAGLARRRIVARARRDGQALRVLPRGPTFELLVGAAFHDLCESAAGKTAVLERLLHALERVARQTDNASRRKTLARAVRRVRACGARSVAFEPDRLSLLEWAARLERSLDNGYLVEKSMR